MRQVIRAGRASALFASVALASWAAPMRGQQAVPGDAQKAATTVRDLQKASSLSDQGNKAFDEGKIEKAEENFRKALEIVPAFPNGHLGLGKVEMKRGRFPEALAEFEGARDGYALLGDTFFDLQMERYNLIQRQIAAYRDDIQKLSDQVNSQSGNTSRLGREMKDRENDIRRLEAENKPTKASASEAPGEVYFFIGNAQFRLGRLDDAIASWETCSRRRPEFAEVNINLAISYWKKGRMTDALQAIARAEALGFPVNPEMKAGLQKAAAEKGASAPAPPAAPTQPTPASPPPVSARREG